jgi:hypothetical protein
MTVARFSEDTDAKWIILLTIFTIALSVGWLMNNHPKSEGSSDSNMVHISPDSPLPAESNKP